MMTVPKAVSVPVKTLTRRMAVWPVLDGNIAEDGCIVKTAGVDKEILTFTGPAKVYESQDDAVEAILGGKVVAGDVVVIRYEGPKAGQACRRCSIRPLI